MSQRFIVFIVGDLIYINIVGLFKRLVQGLLIKRMIIDGTYQVDILLQFFIDLSDLFRCETLQR